VKKEVTIISHISDFEIKKKAHVMRGTKKKHPLTITLQGEEKWEKNQGLLF